jgi:2-methylisocitrate lyase-like PEP mutase family enzyme
MHDSPDLADTIARLQAYQEAGADVLFAPGVSDLESVRQVLASVDRPIDVLARPNGLTVAQLAELGVARVSIGGAFIYAALGTVVEAARELMERGTYEFRERTAIGRTAVLDAVG